MAATPSAARSTSPRVPAILVTLAVALSLIPTATAARTVSCAGKPATIQGTNESEELTGTSGNDVIHGRGGDDVIDGRGGHDVICGGAGDDIIRGGDGNDLIYAGDGNDTVLGGAGTDTIRGGPGADHLKGIAGKDSIDGGPGDDTLIGGAGSDLLEGSGGIDHCHGGDGRDEAQYCETLDDTEVGQVPNAQIRPGPNSIALTFDDGPHPIYTPQVLSILRWYKVRATFFVIGSQAQRYPWLIQRMVDEGHVVLNHSWSHSNLALNGDGTVRYQLQRTQETLVEIAGTQPRCFRPPYGSSSDRVRSIAHGLGLSEIGWDVSAGDWLRPSSSYITDRILNAEPGDVILLHDGGGIRTNTVMALAGILEGFRERGIGFETLCG